MQIFHHFHWRAIETFTSKGREDISKRIGSWEKVQFRLNVHRSLQVALFYHEQICFRSVWDYPKADRVMVYLESRIVSWKILRYFDLDISLGSLPVEAEGWCDALTTTPTTMINCRGDTLKEKIPWARYEVFGILRSVSTSPVSVVLRS